VPFTPLPKALVKTAINYRGQRRALIREQFFRLAGLFTPVLLAEQDGLRFFVRTDDQGVGRLTFADMSLERTTLDNALGCLRALGTEQQALESGWFVDIGANIGTTSITAAVTHRMAGAICIEALPANCDFLEQNAVANGVGDRIRCLRVALSERPGEVEFEQASDNWGDGRVRVAGDAHGDDAYGEGSRALLRVPATTFDTLVERGDVDLSRTAVVWIDAQGHEGQILSGAASLLASDVAVVTEFWPYGLRRAEGLDRFLELVTSGFGSFIDLGTLDDPSRPAPRPIAEIGELPDRYEGVEFTDLLLLSAGLRSVTDA